jgi:class 3 adenylate cyclase
MGSMSWDKQKSLDRIRRRWEARNVEITVSKLTREMNLENVTLSNGRRIQGAHVYATVAGSGKLHCLDSDDHARSAIQRMALWQAEVAKIAKAFDVPIIAFQGGRVHLLVYRPIDDDSKIARKSVLLSRAITYMTRKAFNPLFDEELRLTARAAADLGETVATRGGTKGDSELLFLGNAANRPAKLLDGTSVLTVTTRLTEALGEQLAYETIESGDEDALILRISQQAVEDAVAEDGIDWSVEKSAARLADELEKWPVERFGVGGANALIDPGALSRSNSKLVDAAVILMDIDGFSDYVEKAENDEVKRDAILTLDAIRQEMRDVLKADHHGVRVQYQGDNMIGFVHLPNGDEEKIAIAAAEIAAGMQGSMSITLSEVVPDARHLDVSVGVSMNSTVVACLGEYAKRNGLVLGPAPTEAERIQTWLPGKQTGIDKAVYDSLPEDMQELYEWNANTKAYVAVDLSASKLARVREALAYEKERTITPSDRPGRFSIGGAAASTTGAAEHVRPYRPYAD